MHGKENALFLYVRIRYPRLWCAAVREHQYVKKESASSKLRAVAQMRIEQYFVSAQAETGDGLPKVIADAIRSVLTGNHKTFRYMLFTGLLVAVSDRNLHPRCLQKNAKVEGAYDARTLCQKVVVPFEKKMLNGRLGASNEPFANKSARFLMIEKDNNVRKGSDTETLHRLYDVLEFVRFSDDATRRKAFCWALAVITQMPPSKSSVTALTPLEAGNVGAYEFFDFFESHTGGVSAVATAASVFDYLYGAKPAIKTHPATESGASSNEVGDIDIEFPDGSKIAVEVKDKPYTDVDVNHACEKALAADVAKLIFAVGANAEKSRVHQSALVEVWAERGVELSFLPISGQLGVAMAISDSRARRRMAAKIGSVLDEMNAPQSVKELFAKTFKERKGRK